jgi:Pyruvate/2-oxoacid:ferredoxin oxidoreductase delta subunit
MAEKPVIDADLCTACAACVDACPEGAMYMNDDESLALVNLDKCNGCAACEAVCPTGAITMTE